MCCAQAFDWVEENYFEHLNAFWKLITPGLRRRRLFDVLLTTVRWPRGRCLSQTHTEWQRRVAAM